MTTPRIQPGTEATEVLPTSRTVELETQLAQYTCGEPTHRRDNDSRLWCLDCQSPPA